MPDDLKATRLRKELEETLRTRNEFLIKYRNPNNGNNEEGDDVYDRIKR